MKSKSELRIIPALLTDGLFLLQPFFTSTVSFASGSFFGKSKI